MARKAGWESILAETIEAARHTPFAWGTHDCALWAADCVYAMTGVDYAAPFRGQYQTEAEAKRLIEGQYGSLGGYVSRHLVSVPLEQVRRGDVVMWRRALGICEGGQSFFVTYQGLRAINTLNCEQAWRVD